MKHSHSFTCSKLPVQFIIICVLAFIAGVITVVYFYRSMSFEMPMPGDWTMSMMWMRMPDQTWFAAALSFLLMWLAMMIPMMMPSVLPTFLKTRRNWVSLCYMAFGYFAVWLAAGVAIYVCGVALAAAAMKSELFSHAVPLLSGALLIIAGTLQFTQWKLRHLLRCRSSFGCAISYPQNKTGFQLGCKQGVACCLCCTAPMTIQLTLGIMNPVVMISVAIIIAAEKLFPRPEITAKVTGFAAIILV